MTSEVSVVRKVLCAVCGILLEVHNTDPLRPEARPRDLQWGILHHINVTPGMVLGAGRDEASGHEMSTLSILIWVHQPLIISSDRLAIRGLK